MVTSQKENEGGDDDEARCQQADEPKLVAALLGLNHVLYLPPVHTLPVSLLLADRRKGVGNMQGAALDPPLRKVPNKVLPLPSLARASKVI
jgi:hypothetical protein